MYFAIHGATNQNTTTIRVNTRAEKRLLMSTGNKKESTTVKMRAVMANNTDITINRSHIFTI